MSETGELKRHQSTPEQDLKDIATNTLINSLVHTYWSDDLTAIELRNKARENKDYKEADRIRDELLDKGVLIEDKDGKTLWKFK